MLIISACIKFKFGKPHVSDIQALKILRLMALDTEHRWTSVEVDPAGQNGDIK